MISIPFDISQAPSLLFQSCACRRSRPEQGHHFTLLAFLSCSFPSFLTCSPTVDDADISKCSRSFQRITQGYPRVRGCGSRSDGEYRPSSLSVGGELPTAQPSATTTSPRCGQLPAGVPEIRRTRHSISVHADSDAVLRQRPEATRRHLLACASGETYEEVLLYDSRLLYRR
jgi:hypothetical protein